MVVAGRVEQVRPAELAYLSIAARSIDADSIRQQVRGVGSHDGERDLHWPGYARENPARHHSEDGADRQAADRQEQEEADNFGRGEHATLNHGERYDEEHDGDAVIDQALAFEGDAKPLGRMQAAQRGEDRNRVGRGQDGRQQQRFV